MPQTTTPADLDTIEALACAAREHTVARDADDPFPDDVLVPALRTIRVLEIGAWEGRSTTFLLRQLPLSCATAVDTWEGSIEHAGDPRLARIEQLFDANVARYGKRLTKVKSTSAEFFRNCGQSPGFDLIHVDGSHAADDVLADATSSFALLNPGGVMILDDYLWERGADPRAAPAAAINRFLRENRGRWRLLSVTTQVVLRKAA